jgi:hypothetical protein
MLRCGIPPRVESRGNAAMTATEMEDVLKKLDRRTSRIEQMLATFTTMEDLKAYPTREELLAGFEEAKRHAVMLNEDTRDDIRMLAGDVADALRRLPPQQRFERPNARTIRP